MKLYKKLAEYYDLMFSHDYMKEAKVCDKLIGKKGFLLDIGCGTGGHMMAFKKLGYEVEGLDSSKEMLRVAQKKMPGVIFHKGPMQWLNINKEYDAITLLSRTLLFVKNLRQLRGTLKRIYYHLRPNGKLIMDLDTHEDCFDPEKNQTHYFNNQQGIEGSVTEEYDQRGDKILWSVNLSISENNRIKRLIDNQEFLMVNVNKLLDLMKELGFKVSVHDSRGRNTKKFAQPLILKGVKLIKKASQS